MYGRAAEGASQGIVCMVQSCSFFVDYKQTCIINSQSQCSWLGSAGHRQISQTFNLNVTERSLAVRLIPLLIQSRFDGNVTVLHSVYLRLGPPCSTSSQNTLLEYSIKL